MNPEELRRLYEQAGSCSELARWLGIPSPTMRYHLKRAGIAMTRGYRSPKKVRHYGPDHPNWKGGTFKHSDGYVYEHAPDHPAAKATKPYVLQHRLVVERSLGRYLTASEIVHHRNGDKQDNRLENLEVLTRTKHMQLHKSLVTRDEQGRFQG